MSVAVSRSDGVTVLTLTSDTTSVCPPLCQLLGALCYSPRLCGVSRRLPPQRGGPQAALGALWIITGVLHIGLGAILMSDWSGDWFPLRYTGCPVWMGVLSMFFGVCCILTERYPRPVFVLLSGILNLGGVATSIAGIVFYSYGLNYYGYWHSCSSDRWDYWRHTTPSPSPEKELLIELCQDGQHLLRSLSISFSAILVVLSVLDLCLGLSSSIISFKALRRGNKGQSETPALLDQDRTTTE